MTPMEKLPARQGAVQFKYTARNIEGNTIRGVMKAADRDALYGRLLEQGLYLLSAKEQGRNKKLVPIKSKALGEFCRQLANLLGAGVSLAPALEIIAREDGLTPNLRRVYGQVLMEVRNGASLSEALEQQGVFPDLMLGMVRSGEGTGCLDKISERLAIHFEKRYQMEQQVKSAMTYPIILGVLAVAVVIIIVTFVLPQFEDMFAAMDELPGVTRMLMAASDFLVHQWYLVVLAAVGLTVAVRCLLRVEGVRMRVDRLALNLPILGRLNRVICTARLARSVSSLYASGTPMVSALQVSRDTLGNQYIAKQFDEVLSRLRSGASLSQALAGVDGLTEKLVSVIHVGEETGRLDTMLDNAADAMEYDAQQASRRMVTVLEPLLIIIMAVVVGFIMVAVMAPIIGSYGAIEGSANY